MSKRHDAVTLMDEFLSDTKHQSLIDADRVRDFVLDLRILLAAAGE
jgi:hypothetical protein